MIEILLKYSFLNQSQAAHVKDQSYHHFLKDRFFEFRGLILLEVKL